MSITQVEPGIAMSSSSGVGLSVVPLDRVKRGGSFTVHHIADEQARITALRFGIAEGATASCITRLPAGPVIVRSGRQEIAIGRALARRITVSPHGNGNGRG